jgi:Asp-tRNA(Asn)/Glu-tRNA(Gln) amidotransferase C subunit
MSSLTNEDVLAIAKAVDLEIHEPDLTQVQLSLNAILEGMEQVDIPGLNAQEPLPIIPPQEESDGR